MRKLFIGAVISGVFLAGCSFSIGDTPTNAAEEVIEGELATLGGLSDVSADCDVPPNSDVGTTFNCTASTSAGEVRYLTTIEEDDVVYVEWLNLLTADDVVSLEQAAVDVIEEQVGRRLGYENYACGSGPLALGSDNILNCELIDPDNGDVYDSTLEITDLDTGAFNVEVAEQPRG
ncbi:MAG: hypothetical protein AAF962_26435 [Actinomycetota bacterium]